MKSKKKTQTRDGVYREFSQLAWGFFSTLARARSVFWFGVRGPGSVSSAMFMTISGRILCL